MTKDELIAELLRMLISALDAADHVKRQADRRQARELNALTLATATELVQNSESGEHVVTRRASRRMLSSDIRN